ncbi:MAG: restriction endonuclease [Synergistaceae bacterium]|nr:restriction endonuclease [Synergistaceae bacterium]
MSANTGSKFSVNNDELSDYENLVSQILARVDNLSPAGFEQLITDLLIRMGYEVFKNAKRRVSAGAIQGIIIEDRPGYNPIYIQTRKLEKGSIITSWNMQSFGDAVERKAGRGLLVTNANFSKPAQDYAKQKHIILVDGRILARLMIVHNFCVNVREVVEIKSLDPSAFSGYE